MRRLGTALVPWAVLLALGCVCFARLVALPSGLMVDGQRPSIDFANHGEPRPVGNDATFVFLPHHLYVAKVLARFGHPPVWDSSGFGGRPMVGNPQAGLFYPPVWLAWCSPYPSTLGWLTVIHLLWAGVGTYFLAQSSGALAVAGHGGRRNLPGLALPAGPDIRGPLPPCLGGVLVPLGLVGSGRASCPAGSAGCSPCLPSWPWLT